MVKLKANIFPDSEWIGFCMHRKSSNFTFGSPGSPVEHRPGASCLQMRNLYEKICELPTSYPGEALLVSKPKSWKKPFGSSTAMLYASNIVLHKLTLCGAWVTVSPPFQVIQYLTKKKLKTTVAKPWHHAFCHFVLAAGPIGFWGSKLWVV